MTKSIIVLGGPDSGKSNYLGRLWRALDRKSGRIVATRIPEDINFAMDTAEHLFQGHFAPHTGRAESRKDLEIDVSPAGSPEETTIIVPDFSGELWTTAVRDSEISPEWMAELEEADGALLFIRVDSDQNRRPLDWVTAGRLLEKIGQDDEERNALPTQVMLCELMRFLEYAMPSEHGKPRLCVVVSAWDRVSADVFKKGPVEYLRREYPFFAGRLEDTSALDVNVLGLSVVGGDLKDDAAFRDKYLEEGIDGNGWVAVTNSDGVWTRDPDVTLPISWVMGV